MRTRISTQEMYADWKAFVILCVIAMFGLLGTGCGLLDSNDKSNKETATEVQPVDLDNTYRVKIRNQSPDGSLYYRVKRAGNTTEFQYVSMYDESGAEAALGIRDTLECIRCLEGLILPAMTAKVEVTQLMSILMRA